ncbi:transposase family protein [Moorena bouillonii]|uniref:H repeat-associated protein N-terminal domain-containing protein n=1 Tax=Moorena bouillonii PNG TaxID=568701 RepID=A0A1U7MYE7_9CYAN|nr:hypothetical protein BJP37_06360 [Moorena bouillonii PNG]
MAKGFVKAQQEREALILKNSVLKHFQHLRDPRVERTQKHSLVAMITIAILAVLSGADGFVAIVTYGKAFASVAGDVFRVAQWDSVTRYLWSGVWSARPPGARDEFLELGQLYY